jgi:hypothetical protein
MRRRLIAATLALVCLSCAGACQPKDEISKRGERIFCAAYVGNDCVGKDPAPQP